MATAKEGRVEWFRQTLKHLPYKVLDNYDQNAFPVICRIDYRKIMPPVEKQNDFMFIYSEDLIWHCLHAYMALPSLGLSIESEDLLRRKRRKKRRIGKQ